MLRAFVVAAALLAVAASASAQTDVRGLVVDAETDAPLAGATVLALGPDSTRAGTSVGADGTFRLGLAPGAYELRVSFLGYRTGARALTVGEVPIDLGRLALRADTTQLGETVVEALETRVVVRGDTVVFNAAAYGANPDATAGDLLEKLPGVTLQDGEVQSGGETVTRVLVDGKEFFGDDPRAALENIPADAVRDVEIYDRASERADFTGFDDGEEQRTVNLVTRPERRRSVFGRGQAGAGTDLRYAGSGNVNLFDGDRRASVYARADNVDARTQAALQGDDRPPGPRVFRFRDGITRTLSGGVNLNDTWGEGVEVGASYALSSADNTRDVRLARDYVLAEAAGQRYEEATEAASDGLTHDLNARIEAELSERTEVEARVGLEIEGATETDRLAAETARPGGALLSRTRTETAGDGSGVDADARVELRHRLGTEGRTIAVEAAVSSDAEDEDRLEEVERLVFLADGATVDSTDAFGRRVADRDRSRSVRGEVAYTEPLAEGLQVLVAYRPYVSARDDDREGLRRDDAGAYTVLDTTVTSIADQRLVRHTLGTDVQHQREGLTATIGLAVRHERLDFAQAGPRAFDVSRAATSLLPSARIEAKLGERATLNLRYRSNTDVPDARQLRDVVDDTNPLLLSAGNPDLRTARSHDLHAMVRTADPAAGTSLSGSVALGLVRDYVGTSTVVAGAEPVLADGVTVPPGGRLTVPVNLDGYLRAWSFVSYGRPLAALKSNLNSFVSLGYSRLPGLVDGAETRTDALSGSARLFLGTNASERFDLSVSVGLSGRATLRSVGRAPTPGYVRHQANVDLTWLPAGGLALTGTLDAAYTPDIGADLDPLAARLDLGVGYKFLEGDRGEVRLVVVDVFDQGASVDRRVTDLYVEDRETQALGRFVLASLAYTIRPVGGTPPGPRRGRGRRVRHF